jgi:hypothetical protein
VQAIIERMYTTPPKVVERVKRATTLVGKAGTGGK